MYHKHAGMPGYVGAGMGGEDAGGGLAGEVPGDGFYGGNEGGTAAAGSGY